MFANAHAPTTFTCAFSRFAFKFQVLTLLSDKKIHGKNNIILIVMSLFVCGSIHQGHHRFSSQSRGKQCSFMSLSALLTAQVIPVFEWNSTTVDSVLLQGDNMYMNAFENDLIPREDFLSLNHLPTVVHLPIVIVVEPVETQLNTNDLPIVVEPVEAQNANDLPIVVEPVEAQTKKQINWLEPVEARFINYGKDHQGLVRSEHVVEAHYFTIGSALMNTFANDNYAILILEGYMMALIHGLDTVFYLFDPHARNANGMPAPNGTAVVMKYSGLSELEQYLCSLSNELNTNLFEIVPVSLSSELNTNLFETSIDNARKCKKRKSKSVVCDSEKQTRLEYDRMYQKRKRAEETANEKQTRLKNRRMYQKRKRAEKAHNIEKDASVNQQDYMNEFDILKNGGIEEQCWAKSNINKFHKSVEFSTSQCTICREAWPLMTKPRSPNSYVCSRCSRDKKSPKKFSLENSMIPSSIPNELQNLTQVEEMLIARALPIMRVYIKPGGQRGYSGHCINLPQNVKELATSLPRYSKELSVIIVKVKGRDNTFKDVTVRKQTVHNALLWLIQNNPHYSELQINEHALNSLPENGVPSNLMTVETEDDIVSDDNSSPDLGPPTDNPSEDIVYNDLTDMSSFLPVGEQQQQEIEAVRNQLSENEPMPWPTVENEPLNEYQISYLATMAFPTLFPDGKGDPTNSALLRDVPLQERIKHLLKFAEIIDGKWVYRFANHPRFSYWAFNMIQRKRILQQSGIFLKQNPGEAHLTIDELREMAASNNTNVFMSKVSRYVGNIAGTNAYWNKVREELKAIITNVGAPTLFFTFSSADMHWPELHALFEANTDNDIGNTTSEIRRQNVINNPHLVDWFFTQRLESFVKHWLYNTLGAKWHWFRYEYQGRGSIHCHGTAKLNNDPGLCQITQTALKGFLAQQFKDENDCPDPTELDQDIEAGQNASDTVCQYVDWLLSTINPIPPDEDMWIRPEVHPCQKCHDDIPDHELESDYTDLLNMVQRHTCCSTNYCLRKKSNKSELKCRFHFPFDHCAQTKLEFEKINSKGDNVHYRAKIVTKRNDSRLNNHQQLQLQGWRANCDIQVVIDHYACVEYLTKYAAKGEPRSPMLKQAFNSIVQNLDNNSDPRKAIKKVVMKTLGERDYAAQETMHHLLSLKLHSSSFKVVPVSLNGSRRVRHNAEDGDSCTEDSLLDVYANRQQYDSSHAIMNMNFVQFATTFKVVNNELKKLPENIVPRIFPTYSPNPKGPNFGLYCKYQLLRYKPWQTTQNNPWDDQEPTDEILVNCWQELL